jgi:hypothetical protein
VKPEKEAAKSKLFAKKDSNIDVLSDLISDLKEHKSRDNEELLIQDSNLKAY